MATKDKNTKKSVENTEWMKVFEEKQNYNKTS